MRRLLVSVSLILAACGSGSSPTAAPSAVPPAFDVSAVKVSFEEECADPIVFDELFCEQVEIAMMSADEDILNVPTTLAAEADDRGAAICEQLAVYHFDAEGVDLGYEYIGINDRDGGNLAACSVP